MSTGGNETGDSGSREKDLRAVNCPRHVGIIMDGNNRWARARNLPGIAGHRAGVEAIRSVLQCCDDNGVEALTLFAFSSENWQRPENEVSGLMRLFLSYLRKEVTALHQQGIRLRFIGRRDRLSPVIVRQMEQAEELTRNNGKRTLVLAVDYGGRWDVVNAATQLAKESSSEGCHEEDFDAHVSTAGLPTLDLCIRTGGEYRISNFLLWQCAYAELYFTDCYWPDFDEAQMSLALQEFSSRQRRFGRTQEQLEADSSAGQGGLDTSAGNA